MLASKRIDLIITPVSFASTYRNDHKLGEFAGLIELILVDRLRVFFNQTMCDSQA